MTTGEFPQALGVQTATASSTLVISLSSLCVALVALRLTREQARAYLYPVPAIFADPGHDGIVIRNFGFGAMVDIWATIHISSVGDEPVHVTHHVPSLADGDVAVLLQRAEFANLAIIRIEAVVAFRNIRRRKLEHSFVLTPEQMTSLGT